MCGGGSAGGTASTIGNVANWTACFQACDGYSGCTGFTYNQGAAFGNGAGQCLIKTDSPQSFVSTAQLLSTRIAGFIPPSCPASNGTTYANAGGVQYTILCTYDTSVNTISASSSVGSFGDCAVLCDTTSGCTGLTWNGTFCSLKQSFGQYILGAVKA
ncbi:hypothetical protein D6D13_01839 [Aureobasidium pullulans]|uniref:Apple domain-containing protein n=1 Tax=Aureobasidium pullulans TaxID=5580 RepID=A0A4S9D7G0_AURPU|nr:hypothetical protein D6D13_01839 [Aureobasidium pullulans]